jgi:hypothetical protein
MAHPGQHLTCQRVIADVLAKVHRPLEILPADQHPKLEIN